VEQPILTQKAKYQEMRAGYDQLVSRLLPQQSADVAASPIKRELAAQEGYAPKYNPNSDTVTWTQKPQPAYQQSPMMNLEGSMSPERLVESYPAFKWKQANLDGLLGEIITKALSGEITTQRARELVHQLAIDTEKEAWGEGSAKGAGKSASSFSQALDKATTKNGVAA
jgi:hypothetical protein